MMPILHSPGVMMPGQLGPISLTSGHRSMLARALTMSMIGMPSVMQMMVFIPACAASVTASAANAAGTMIMLASAAVSATASSTVSNTGRSRWVCPPRPGVTPPATWVPYSIACSAWNVPWRPVKPWTITLVLLSTRTAISSLPGLP